MSDTWWVDPAEMNDEQRAIVQIPDHGNYLVLGPPGSGKTNLLLLRAEYLVRSGKPNLRVIVFTRALKAFLAACPAPYAVDAERIKTLRAWEAKLIHELGGVPSPDSDFTKQRRQNCEIIHKKLDRSDVGQLYDALLLDEAQDFLPEEVDIFRRVAGQVFEVDPKNWTT